MADQLAPSSPPEGDELADDAAVIINSSLFDEKWYCRTYPHAPREKLQPALHYLQSGAAAGCDPGPLFSTAGYLTAHPDVAAAGINPLLHYVRFGRSEGREYGPAATSSRPYPRDADAVRASTWFDAAWYQERYPDVAEADIDPATHYLTAGAEAGRDPGPLFSTSGYLAAHPDVARAAMNPLIHYINHGAAEGRSIRDDHLRWIKDCEHLTARDRAAIAEHVRQLDPGPLISVIVPTFNTSEADLSDMVSSVKRQLYANWELCIADDASTLTHVRELLAHFTRTDSRIKVVERSANGGIAAATNSALSVATGDFLALLDHDDILHETALYEVAAEIARAPDANLIFSDSDELDEHGVRSHPYFKHGWNHEVMLGQNLISHLGVYRREVVSKLGGVREGFDGSQDYDLALRVIDASRREQILHIPAVLYHWRRGSAATSFSDRWLTTCIASARRALSEHLARNGVVAQVTANRLHPMWSRIVYALPPQTPAVAIVIPFAVGDRALAGVIEDLRVRTSYPDLRFVIVADDEVHEADERDLAYLSRQADVRVVRRRAALTRVQACSVGIAACEDSDVVVLAHSDMAVRSSSLWLEELVSQVMRPGIAAAGPAVWFGDGNLKDAGGLARFRILDRVSAHNPGYFGLFCIAREVSALRPTALALRRSALLEAGGLDPTATTLDAAASDICGRLRAAGQRLIWTPFSAVYDESVGDRAESARAGQGGGEVETTNDPFYSPNLCLEKFAVTVFPSRRRKPWAEIRARLDIREGQAHRARTLMRGVHREARILEIGASYSPIAPRADGWRTTIIDHAPREELVAKYAGEPDVWTDRIEEVDFVWTGGSLADAVPTELHGRFDVLIASHMIEHSTDVLGFLRAAERLLSLEGAIIFAVPDKRYCFDAFRPLTISADIIEAHQEARSRHTWKTGFEHLAYSVLNDGNGAWGQEPVGRLRFGDSLGDAMRKLEDRLAIDGYADFHAWKFTPASFQLILLETCALGLCDWAIETISEATGCEFHARLRRGGAAAAAEMSADELGVQRMALLRRTMEETREQLHGILGRADQTSEATPARRVPGASKRWEAAQAEVALPLGYAPARAACPPRLAVVLHLFHADLSAEFRAVLETIPVPFDLFISTSDEDRASMIRTSFRGWLQGEVIVRILPNRGRDVAAKVAGFRDIYASHDLLLFLHSKKSLHSVALDGWRQHLLSSLVGSAARVAGVLEMFERRPTLGVVAAPHFGPISSAIGWGKNFDLANMLAARMGLKLTRDDPVDMPSGSMFWARPAALEPLLALDLNFEDFPPECGQVDGTLAHAIERLFFHICERGGFEWVKIAQENAPLSAAIISPEQLDATVERAIRSLRLTPSSDNLVVFPSHSPPSHGERSLAG